MQEDEAGQEHALLAAQGPDGPGGVAAREAVTEHEGRGDPTLRRVTKKLIEQQDLYNGFGNGLALAFELAVTPVIFGLMGYGLDRWLGTLPLFTIVLVLLCVVGLGVRQYYEYSARMEVHEASGPWARKVKAEP